MNYNALIVAIAAFSMVGCTTMRPIDTQEADLTEVLEPGDHIVVYEKSGRIVDMTFTSFDGGKISGQLESGAGPVSAAVDDIEQLEIEKPDGGKTTLAAVGGTIVIVPLVLIALLVGAGAQGFAP